MPHPIIVNNLARPIPTPSRVIYCDSFACRLRGLMFRRELGQDEGLLLVQARDSRIDSSIHMFFVPFDLAVFWIDSRGYVVDKVIARPWRPAYASRAPARYILELHPSRWTDYEPGELVEFVDA
jgi:uncharacterized membrane protein (UPF0127 family)